MHNIQTLGAVHLLFLIALSWHSASRLLRDAVSKVCAVFLLTWCNLVYTSLVLAGFSKLNTVGLYFSVSVALAIGIELLLRLRHVVQLPLQSTSSDPQAGRFDRMIRRILFGSVLMAAIGSALICLAYVPNNWDSLTYRFTRAFFYLAQGNLLHFGNPWDPRLLFYPFNGALAYLFLANYQYSEKWFYAVTFLAWVFAGLGAYFVARRLGASRMGSFVAAWISLMSPSMLSQAASTNDEVLAATPILIGLGFAVEWFATARKRYAILAGIGIGLGCGSKLHWVFYSGFIIAASVLLAIRLVRRASVRQDLIHRIPGLAAAASVALPMVGAFLVCSYVSSGELTNNHFNDAVLNRPFRLSLAREVIRINTAELFVSPIPDLAPPVCVGKAQAVYASFNKFFMKCCFSDLVETTKRSPQGYLFEGPANLEGFRPNEYTVWLGFLPHLLLLACVVGALSPKLPPATQALAASFFIWHVTYAIQNRFIPTASVYYSFPAVIAAGALGPAWDRARSSTRWTGRVLLVGFFAAFLTHIVLGSNLLFFGGLRNLQFLFPKGRVTEMHAVSPDVERAIQSADQVYLPNTHWEVLYWNFMRFNPAAHYTTGLGLRLPSPNALMVLGVAREGAADLVPAKLPDGTVPGLTYLGYADGEPVFAQGGRVEENHLGPNGYVLLPVSWIRDAGNGAITGLKPKLFRQEATVVCCIGLKPTDGIELRYQLGSSSTGERLARDWSRPGQADDGLSSASGVGFDFLTIETRSAKHPDEVVRTVRRLDRGGYHPETDERSYSAASEGAADWFSFAGSAASPELPVRILEPAPEPYDFQGKHITVSWLRRETTFVVRNGDVKSQAVIEMQMVTANTRHTAVLLANGSQIAPAVTIQPSWLERKQMARFEVTLSPGQNQFVLASRESPIVLADGRQVCFLLIGDISAKAVKR